MNALKLIDESLITLDERNEISAEIDSVIDGYGNNRQEINRLVFAGIACLTEAEEKQTALNNKTGLQRFIGSITGTNHKLEKAIGGNLVKAQYAAQQALKKLAEQNMMSFELIAAVNNKLNGQVMRIDSEIDGVKNNIYRGLNRFLKMYQSHLVQTELRLEKLEGEVELLKWAQSIECQMLNGIPYEELDDKAKTGCLIHDFYEKSHGEWNLSDLRLLKATLKDIGLSPNDEINYLDALVAIHDYKLLDDELSGKSIEVDEYVPLTATVVLDKLNRLETDERNQVEFYKRHIGKELTDKAIRNELTELYLKDELATNVNSSVSRFDFILEMLFNLSENRRGNADDLLKQGIAYENGDGVKQDFTHAAELYKQVADLGNAEAMQRLGYLYYVGKGINQDYNKAKAWYEKAVENGDENAMYWIGHLYEKGNGVEQSYSKAKEWYEKAAENGDEYAMFRIGILYENGNGVEQSYSKAKEWYEKAAENGNEAAMFWIGFLYQKGNGVEQSYSKAKEWYKKAAEHDYSTAMLRIGYLYRDGNGVEKNYSKAKEWFEKAAEHDLATAMFELGYLYENGNGVEQSYSKAKEWYEKAAEHDHATAMLRIGYLYENGNGVEQSYSRAKEWYEKAAEHDLATAMFELGYLYENGNGVEQSYSKAKEWYEKAAEHDHATAMLRIGYLYKDGDGVEQSYSKAKAWFEKAAEHDLAMAMLQIGYLYKDGNGVKKNPSKAEEWFRKAADYDNAVAMYWIGFFYEERSRTCLMTAGALLSAGKNLVQVEEFITENMTIAEEWYKKSANHGCEDAAKALKRLHESPFSKLQMVYKMVYKG